jgi:hypothetical protein
MIYLRRRPARRRATSPTGALGRPVGSHRLFGCRLADGLSRVALLYPALDRHGCTPARNRAIRAESDLAAERNRADRLEMAQDQLETDLEAAQIGLAEAQADAAELRQEIEAQHWCRHQFGHYLRHHCRHQ